MLTASSKCITWTGKFTALFFEGLNVVVQVEKVTGHGGQMRRWRA
jgi:hypothetical protein